MILPTLKQLRYLVAVSDHKHFGHAADACFVTQSTLSTGLKELENLLGVMLVERTKRSVLMTSIGGEIVLRAKEILRQSEELVDLAKSDGQPLSGRLRLGIIPTVCPYLLPATLPIVKQKFPNLQLLLREDKTADLLGMLALGELDLVLMALPYAMQGVKIIPLGIDIFEAAFPQDHALNQKPVVALNDLLTNELLLLEEGHCLRDHALNVCKVGRDEMRSDFEATSLLTLIQMVDAGLGVTLLPKMAIQAGLIRGTNLITRPIEGDENDRQIGLVYRKTSNRAEEFQLLASVFKQSLKV